MMSNNSTIKADVADVLAQMGAAGLRLDAIDACEAGAGNISVAAPGFAELDQVFPTSEPYPLPVAVPALAGWVVLVTGSGCRLRDVAAAPAANVAAVEVGEDGLTGVLRSGPGRAFATPTSEFNSHLAVHQDWAARLGARATASAAGAGASAGDAGDAGSAGSAGSAADGASAGPGPAAAAEGALHAVVHAQPPHLVALTHRTDLGDSADFSRRILRWEPETVVQLPEGVAVLPFMVPGSKTLADASVAALRAHRVVLWSKHGLMVRSEAGPLKAVDLIEYAETGAMYDQANTACGSPSEGLTPAELRAVIEAFNVQTTLF
jgi:rhamnulose-1-phosphate aldolase